MLLRRVMEHVKTQNWTAVAIDFVIVVLGVFIGLQVNNWNQYAADRRAEATFLRQLQDDLQNILAQIDAQIEFEQFHVELAKEVYDLIRYDASDERALKIAIGLGELAQRRTLRTQSPTFLNLQGSGKLDLISDPVLRADIISYFYGTSRLEAALDKNNTSFIDQAYDQFMLVKSIPPRNWDSDLMNMALPSSASSSSAYVTAALTGPLYAAGGAALAAPPEAEIWNEIVPRLAWRGQIAATNTGIARILRAATEVVDEKLARNMDRRTP